MYLVIVPPGCAGASHASLRPLRVGLTDTPCGTDGALGVVAVTASDQTP